MVITLDLWVLLICLVLPVFVYFRLLVSGFVDLGCLGGFDVGCLGLIGCLRWVVYV